MKLPKRFALSTLLFVMLLASLACGFVQWRRLRLIEEVKSLNAIGSATFPIAENTYQIPTFNAIQLRGEWWPTAVPQPVSIRVKIDDFGKSVIVGGEKYTVDGAKRAIADLRRRLVAVGITDVSVAVGNAIYNFDAAEQLEAAE